MPAKGAPGSLLPAARGKERTSDTSWTNMSVEFAVAVPAAPIEKWGTNPYGHHAPEDPKRQAAWWRMIRAAIFKRAKRRCARCKKHVALTVHHIIPRDEEGTDDLDNLVALCMDCHNWVEGQVPPLRTFSEIRDSMPGPIRAAKIMPMGSYDTSRPKWHEWVYGGGWNERIRGPRPR